MLVMSGSGGRMGKGGTSSMWTSTQKIFKLEPTDVIPSSSHAKKLAFLYQNFVFGWNKKWKFFFNRPTNSTVLNKLQ